MKHSFGPLSAVLIAVALTLSALPALCQLPIKTIEDLQQIGILPTHPLDGHYVLTGNINASATATWVSGSGFSPLGHGSAPFTGIFDGQGYAIRGLVINRPLIDDVGLFSIIGSGGVVRNVGLVNASITGKNKVGCLAGTNAGSISNCYATGSATSMDLWGGGLVAVNEAGGELDSCAADVEVAGRYYLGGLIGDNKGTATASFATGNVTGTGTAGGLAGYHDGTIMDCYARGAVTGEVEVGGLVGTAASNGSISRCYAAGPVAGDTTAGGLVGLGLTGSHVENAYWNTETTGQDISDGGAGRSTAQMTHPYAVNLYEGWNFTWIWAVDNDYSLNDGYPYLLNNLPLKAHGDGGCCGGCSGNGTRKGFGDFLGDLLLLGMSLSGLLLLRKHTARS